MRQHGCGGLVGKHPGNFGLEFAAGYRVEDGQEIAATARSEDGEAHHAGANNDLADGLVSTIRVKMPSTVPNGMKAQLIAAITRQNV